MEDMFDLMYEEFYNPGSGKVERRKLTPEMVKSHLENRTRSDLLDLNVVYKRQTKKSLLSIRLYSFVVDKKGKSGEVVKTVDGYSLKERVVKFQFESGQFDQGRQQGSRMISQMRFNMDVEEFAYFCEIMKSGKVPALIKRSEGIAAAQGKKYPDPAYEIYKEVEGAGKRFKIYKGSAADMCIETSQEPLKNNQNTNNVSSVKIVHGLSLKEAGELGYMGALALETLNLWYAFGKAEENLALINTRPSRKDGASANAGNYQNAGLSVPQTYQNEGYAANGGGQMMPDERYEQEVAAMQRGFNQTGYTQNYGYPDQGYANNGYAQQAVWQ